MKNIPEILQFWNVETFLHTNSPLYVCPWCSLSKTCFSHSQSHPAASFSLVFGIFLLLGDDLWQGGSLVLPKNLCQQVVESWQSVK